MSRTVPNILFLGLWFTPAATILALGYFFLPGDAFWIRALGIAACAIAAFAMAWPAERVVIRLFPQWG